MQQDLFTIHTEIDSVDTYPRVQVEKVENKTIYHPYELEVGQYYYTYRIGQNYATGWAWEKEEARKLMLNDLYFILQAKWLSENTDEDEIIEAKTLLLSIANNLILPRKL